MACGYGLTGMRERFEHVGRYVDSPPDDARDSKSALSSDSGCRMIRVVLVDDQTLVRQGVRSLLGLASDIDVVARPRRRRRFASSQRAGRTSCSSTCACPEGRRRRAARCARRSPPPTIILTTFDDEAALLEAVRPERTVPPEGRVARTARPTAFGLSPRGGSVIKPAVTERLLSGIEHVRRVRVVAADPLTEREIEILRLMTGGYSNREIADALASRRHGEEPHLHHPVEARRPRPHPSRAQGARTPPHLIPHLLSDLA